MSQPWAAYELAVYTGFSRRPGLTLGQMQELEAQGWVCEVELCECCLLAAGADGCGECQHDAEPLSLLVGYDITLGIFREQHPQCASEDDCECDQIDSSGSRCKGCGGLSGDRHLAQIWRRGEGS